MSETREGRARVEFNAALGRPVRSEPLEDLGTSTLVLLRELIGLGDWAGVEELFGYYRRFEINRMLDLFQLWIWESIRWMVVRLGQDAGTAAVADSVRAWTFRTSEEDLDSRLGAVAAALPVALMSHQPLDDIPRGLVLKLLGRESELVCVRATGTDQLPATITDRDSAGVLGGLERYSVAARTLHDDMADCTWALATTVQQMLGEDMIGEFFRETLGPWTKSRTPNTQLSNMTALDSLRYSVEGMRSHFSGPLRDGSISVEENDDYYTLVLDPGGTCERMRRGDPLLGTGPRTEPPYNFGVTEQPHPWSWGKAGVGLYCAHCCVVNEILPMEQLGKPKRITEYPDDADKPCRWLIYKDWQEMPNRYRTRVGLGDTEPTG